MTQWELNTYHVNIGMSTFNPTPSFVWTEKNKKTGKTAWDDLTAMAADGWELVSVTPISGSNSGLSFTTYLVYTFKRPKA